MNCTKCGKNILKTIDGLCEECIGYVSLPDKKRRFHIEIKCGADSLKELEDALNRINTYIIKNANNYFQKNKTPFSSINNNKNYGWFFVLQFDPEMTQKKYFQIDG